MKEFLGVTESIVSITFFHIQLDNNMTQFLGEALKSTKTLSILRFTSCTFSSVEAFSNLSAGLCGNDSIEILELFDNSLNDSYTNSLKSIINSSAKRQNEQAWIHNLRDRSTKESSFAPKKGLLHLNISNNELTDDFIGQIVSSLSFNQFLKVFQYIYEYKK